MIASSHPVVSPAATRSAAPTSHLVRWLLSSASFAMPQAAAPIAFSLVALPLTGDTGSGAAMMLAMTLAQVTAAVPLARAGARRNTTTYLRVLVAFRAAAFGVIAVLAGVGAGFPFLVAAAALAGLAGGAAYGYQRSLLNHLVTPPRLPRALGIAATLNEGTFVAAPVLAALLGARSPVAAVVVFAVLGAAPLVLLPRVQSTVARAHPRREPGPPLTSAILLWLCCSAATSAAVAVVEIGAVALAVDFGIGPAWAFVFTVALCVASVSGGVWVSVANRPLGRRAVTAALSTTVLGSALVAVHFSVVVTVVGAVLIGAVLAPLATHYSLTVDRLAPPDRRPETFAMLRTATAVSVIVVSTLLAVVPLQAALVACTATVLAGTLAVVIRMHRPAAEFH